MAVDLSFGGTSFPRAFEVRQALYQNGGEGVSPRFRLLDRRDAFYKCCEYDHQTTDWNGKPADALETISPQVLVPYGYTQPGLSEVSVRERRPTAPLRLCPLIVDRFSDLLFSEDRIPDVVAEGDEEADDFLRAVFAASGFWSKMYEARSHGGSMGSSLVTVGLKEGAFSYRPHSPKIVHDILWEDRDQLLPAGVLIQYLTMKTFEVLDAKHGRPTGEIREVPYVYRRIIDEEWDLVFKEAQLLEDGTPPSDMEIDLRASYQHRLGRFPGVWVQNLPNTEEIDGIPDCDGAFQLIDAADRLYAQANFALMANMDPTLVISRDPKMKKLGGGIAKGSKNAIDVGLQGSAQYLEIGGAGITAALALAKEFRQAVLDKTSCILPGADEAAGAMSAKAIEYRYAPMLAKAGRLRTQWGGGIQRLAQVTLELARLWQKPELYRGNAVPKFKVPRRVIEVPHPTDPEAPPAKLERDRLPGTGGTLNLAWGPFFSPTPSDVQTDSTTLVQAKDGGLIDSETAIRKGAPLFGVKDAGALVRKVRAEQEEKSARQSALVVGGPLGGMESDLADDFARQQGTPPLPADEGPGPGAGEGDRP